MKYEWNGMLFDWDEEKNALNIEKHGRSFLDSHLVWLQPHGQLLAGNTDSEERLVRRGIIENQVRLCVFTMRDDKYRVMSLRPAHKKEKGNSMTKKKVSVEEFDKMVDDGDDLSSVLVPVGVKSVMIDLPSWMVAALDEEARRLNVARKALINIWLADRIQNNQQALDKKKA